MERRRHWETRRILGRGGGIMYYNEEVRRGVATSGEVAWMLRYELS